MGVYKRGKTWTARVFWRDQHKARHSTSQGGFKTKREATLWFDEKNTQLNKGVSIGSDPVFVEYFWKCYKVFTEPHCRPETKRSFGSARKVLESYWGDTRIKSITPMKWQAFLNYLAKHYAKSSIIMYHKKYHVAVKRAIQENIILSDFTYGSKISRGSHKRTKKDKVKLPSLARIQDILNKLLERRSPFLMSASEITKYGRKAGKDKGNICDYVLIMQILTGARIGEALALRQKDLHPQNNTIDIHHSFDSITRELGPTKTAHSYRTIVVPPQIFSLFDELQEHNHSEYVFGSPTTGLPPAERSVGFELKRVLAILNLPMEGFTTHTLRHAQAAILLHKKVDWYYVMQRMGHSSLRTTLDTYGYLIEESKKIDESQIVGLFENTFF